MDNLFDLPDLVTAGSTPTIVDSQTELELDTSSFFDLDNDDVSGSDEAGYSMQNKPEEESPVEEGEEELFDFEKDDETGDDIIGQHKRQFDESVMEVANSFDSIPEDTLFKVGGNDFAKSDLVSALKSREVTNEYNNRMSQMDSFLKGKYEEMVMSAQGLTSETDARIEAYENAKSMTQDPATIGSYEIELQQLYKLRGDNNSKAEAMRRGLLQTRQGIAKAAQERLDYTMTQQVGYTWQEEKQQLLGYARTLGFSEAEIAGNTTPAFMNLLMKAKGSDALNDRNTETLNRIKSSPNKRVSKAPVSTNSSSANKQASGSKKKQAEKLYGEGRLSNSDAFGFLED